MSSFLSVNPGLLFWSIINFLVFLVVLYLIGGKKFIQNIKDREDLIRQSISAADDKQKALENLTNEITQRMKETQTTIDESLRKSKEYAEAQAQRIVNDAQKNKENLLKEAMAEIEHSKQVAMNEIRSEVASLVIAATEKIIVEKLDTEKDKKLVNLYIDQLAAS